MRYLITILTAVFIMSCGGNSIVSPAPDEPVLLTPPAKTAAGDGTLMSETELVEYFANLYIIEIGIEAHDPAACTIWWVVYDYIIHTQLAHPDYVFNMVEMYEDDGFDIPDYLDNEPPC